MCWCCFSLYHQMDQVAPYYYTMSHWQQVEHRLPVEFAFRKNDIQINYKTLYTNNNLFKFNFTKTEKIHFEKIYQLAMKSNVYKYRYACIKKMGVKQCSTHSLCCLILLFCLLAFAYIFFSARFSTFSLSVLFVWCGLHHGGSVAVSLLCVLYTAHRDFNLIFAPTTTQPLFFRTDLLLLQCWKPPNTQYRILSYHYAHSTQTYKHTSWLHIRRSPPPSPPSWEAAPRTET